jgi:DNA mismatch repair protein MutS2
MPTPTPAPVPAPKPPKPDPKPNPNPNPNPNPHQVSSKLGGAVDRASDLGTLWIIHGHGTGSLKQEVLSLLKQEPLVERWEDAPQKEGGSGCTLAYLK